jgi:bacterioferritin
MEPISKEQLITLLNEDIQLEYAAAIQYIQHYSVLEGAQFDAIREHLLEHAEEEIEHAVKLSDRVNYMGGIPTANVSAVKTSKDAVEMLQQDLAEERRAVSRYKERITQAQAIGEFGLVQLIQSILADEEEHEQDLETSLGSDQARITSPEAPIGGPVQDYAPVMQRFAELRASREARSNL